MSFYVGNESIDRNNSYTYNYTYVDKNNPSDTAGVIKSIEIWALASLSNVQVATFSASGDNLTTRDYETIGSVTGGSKQTFPVSLNVEIGDYIGTFFTAGSIEMSDGSIPSTGCWLQSGDKIPCSGAAFIPTANRTISLYGIGPTIPIVTTQAVTDVAVTTATGNGNITDTGGENATKRGVCWNTTGSPTVADSKSEELGSFGTGAFTRPVTGLAKGEKYYVKAYAYNSAGYSYGAEVTFYTKPAITTYAPTDILRSDPTKVTANALIELDTTGTIATRGFKYGLTSTGDTDESESDSYSEGAFSLQITGLTEDTIYYVRAHAASTGTWATVYGSYVEFKTAYPYGSYKTKIKSEATASSGDIADVGGKRSLTINNHLIQNQTVADLIANAYLDEYKDQKTKLVVTRPTPAPFEIGDTITRGSDLFYYAAVSALISYAPAASAEHCYSLADQDMLIRKLNVSFSAGNYISIIELESS